MTVQEIITHINKVECNSNANVLKTMLTELQESDNPDLSGITATADKILTGFKGVDTLGAEVVGTCSFNATLPEIPAEVSWVSASELPSGKYAIVLVDDVWTLVHN